MYQILVCDDDHDIVSALEIYLTGEGYGVTGAYSGQEAIDLFQQNQFHLVLMDIMMPGMDGIAATAELRKLSNVPIIFLTAKSEDTDKILGLNMGADDYITKPFNPLEVIARVRSHLRRYTQLGGQISAPHLFTVGSIVLDDGAVCGIGTHAELMRSCGVYREIYYSQFPEERPAAVKSSKETGKDLDKADKMTEKAEKGAAE